MQPDATNETPVVPVQDRVILRVVCGYAVAFVVFGLVLDGPAAVLRGLLEIVTTRDALLTDYFGIGGIGAACVNAGLLTLCAALVYHRTGTKMTGSAVACLFLVLGFGLFGKNLLNIWSIVLGVALYARFKGEPFSAHVNTAFFGAALAPVFSEILFSSALALEVRLPLAVVTSLVIGFLLAPAAAQLFKAHAGYSLYNMGFTAGIVGTLVVATYKSYGFVPDPVMIWTTGNNRLLGSFMAALFVSMVAIGFMLDHGLPRRLSRIMRESGQAPTDFIAIAGFGPTLANMGLTGALGTLYVLRGWRRPQWPRDRRDPHHRRLRGLRQALPQHRADHAGRVSRLARQAMERRRSVDPARGAVRHDARADRGTLRMALGHRCWRRALFRGDERGHAARGAQSLQQRIRGGHRRGGARARDRRDQGGSHSPRRRARCTPGRREALRRMGQDASAFVPRPARHCCGSRKSHATSTNGAVSAGIANGVSATLSAACATTVNTVPSAA